MAAKIIGFHKNHTTRRTLTKEPMFLNAVRKAVGKMSDDSKEQIELMNKFTTKRQASKFFRGQGIIYNSTIGKG